MPRKWIRGHLDDEDWNSPLPPFDSPERVALRQFINGHFGRLGKLEVDLAVLGDEGQAKTRHVRRAKREGKPAVKCWATRRDGKRCTNDAVFGARVCRMHGGTTRKSRVAAGVRMARTETTRLVGKLGTPVEADPRAVLLEMVYSAYGMQTAIGHLLQLHDASELMDEDAQVRQRLRSLMNQHGYWSEKAAQFSALAVRAGIEERLVKLAESQAMTVVNVLRGALSTVKLEPEQERELLAAVATQLRLLMPGQSAPQQPEPSTNGRMGVPTDP